MLSPDLIGPVVRMRTRSGFAFGARPAVSWIDFSRPRGRNSGSRELSFS